MDRKKVLARGLASVAAAVFAAFALGWQAKANAVDEIARLAVLMEWKAGTIVADIGAGDGKYTFAASRRVGDLGKVYATEIDTKLVTKLQGEVAKRHLKNVQVEQSAEADTNLPAECCDAIFLRHVYHHLTKPAEFDAKLVRSLKPGGRLAIIDFPARSGLDRVEGVPSNRGGHGIPETIVIEELTAAGLQVEKDVKNWDEDDYCVLFVRK
ncbi:MAG TPA: class I SAM-dependent methyltransferase [Candidatus Dormibacteraeota bacterium]|nr:class I SAM-dependent methyltransferase [Candidatus Dormibacteraeota bacterium]